MRLNPDYSYRAILVKVIDADTVDLKLDLGFYMNTIQRFRLARINAPEIRSKNKKEKAKGLEAKQFVLDTLTKAKAITAVSIKTEKYGRWLLELFADAVNVNDLLVAKGLAKKYQVD